MKTTTRFAIMKVFYLKMILLLAILSGSGAFTGLYAQRTLPATDQFEYAAGPLQLVGVDWTRISGSGNDLVVSDGNVTYNGYLGPKGRKALLTNGATDDLKLSFTGQSSPGTTVYCSFVLNVLNTSGLSSAGTYSFILGSGTNNFAARVYIKSSGSGYTLGISKTATAPVSWSTVLPVSSSLLVVFGYEIISGSGNDVVSLWIDPSITTNRPVPEFSTSSGADFGGGSIIDGFMLRQATGTPNASIDDIGISTSWSDLFDNPVYTFSGSIGAGSFNDFTVSGNMTSLTLTSNISVNGNLSLADAVLILDGNSLSFGTNGILKYSGNASQTTTADEFPAMSGPKDLIIENQAGVVFNLDRILTGKLTIAQGSVLSISPLKTLTVQGNTTLNSSESLVIKSDATGTGSFIDNGIITGSGTAKVERYLTGYTSTSDLKYHFISSPVNAQSIQPLFVGDPPIAGDDFYKWDEASATWINSKDAAGSWNSGFEAFFMPGKGYLISYQSDMTKNFTGILNSNQPASPFTINCTWTDPSSGGGDGWNLAGNPYPSAIDWNLVTRGSGIDNALYYYDALAENYRYYIQYQPGFALGNGSRYIPAMQGFMVHANNSGDRSISISNTCRIHQSMSTYYKNSISMKNVLKLNIEADDRSDELFILLKNDASQEFDASSDAYKLFSLNMTVPQIWSITPEGTELAVNALPGNDENLVIPIGIRSGNSGNCTVTSSGTDSFDHGTMITIEDLKNGTIQDLRNNPVYHFTGVQNDNPERFLLHILGANGVTGGEPITKTRIYPGNQSVSICPGESFRNGKVILYDISGKELLSRNLAGPELVTIHTDVYPGLYLVKVIYDGNVQVEKVLIQ